MEIQHNRGGLEMSKKLDDIIESESELIVQIKQKNTLQDSRLFCCNKVEYKNNHLFFWSGDALIFKIWLEKNYKNIHNALKDLNIRIGDLHEMV